MSVQVVGRLQAQFGDRILETSSFRGDDLALVAPNDWLEVATFMRRELQLNQFVDMTAVDYPEREPELARFDVVLMVRSFPGKARVHLKTRVRDGEALPTLIKVWGGTDWAEREIWDMFGIRFDGHPDLRRILMYDEFVGFPLRKDYPIDRTQPLVPYLDVAGLVKLPPFGREEGQPFARIDWDARLAGANQQVSPAIAQQQGQRQALSESIGSRADPRASTQGKE